MAKEPVDSKITKALRDLVSEIYNTCYGAYGSNDGNCYQGQFEREIQKLAQALTTDMDDREAMADAIRRIT